MRSPLTALAEDGYVILEAILARDELLLLQRTISAYEVDRPTGRNSFEGEHSKRIYSLAGKDPIFMRLAEHASIVALADALLLPNWLLSTMQSIRLLPGETPQPWHTDDTFYPIPRPHPILALSVIWALEPFTADNGATEVIPGSHLWGDQHPDDAPRQVRKAIMPAGSALVFDGGLWHRGGANSSTGTRLCVSPQYCQPWLRPQESQLLIAPPDVARNYSERGRAMLGYSIHPPFIGQVDGMHPLRLIDGDYRTRKTDAHAIADRVLTRPIPGTNPQRSK